MRVKSLYDLVSMGNKDSKSSKSNSHSNADNSESGGKNQAAKLEIPDGSNEETKSDYASNKETKPDVNYEEINPDGVNNEEADAYEFDTTGIKVEHHPTHAVVSSETPLDRTRNQVVKALKCSNNVYK